MPGKRLASSGSPLTARQPADEPDPQLHQERAGESPAEGSRESDVAADHGAPGHARLTAPQRLGNVEHPHYDLGMLADALRGFHADRWLMSAHGGPAFHVAPGRGDGTYSQVVTSPVRQSGRGHPRAHSDSRSTVRDPHEWPWGVTQKVECLQLVGRNLPRVKHH
jgi:hypothetical protein